MALSCTLGTNEKDNILVESPVVYSYRSTVKPLSDQYDIVRLQFNACGVYSRVTLYFALQICGNASEWVCQRVNELLWKKNSH